MQFKKVCLYKRCMHLPVTAEQFHCFTFVSDATAAQFELCSGSVWTAHLQRNFQPTLFKIQVEPTISCVSGLVWGEQPTTYNISLDVTKVIQSSIMAIYCRALAWQLTMTYLNPAGDFLHVTAPCPGFQLFSLARATQPLQVSDASSALQTAPSSPAQDENDSLFLLSWCRIRKRFCVCVSFERAWTNSVFCC